MSHSQSLYYESSTQPAENCTKSTTGALPRPRNLVLRPPTHPDSTKCRLHLHFKHQNLWRDFFHCFRMVVSGHRVQSAESEIEWFVCKCYMNVFWLIFFRFLTSCGPTSDSTQVLLDWVGVLRSRIMLHWRKRVHGITKYSDFVSENHTPGLKLTRPLWQVYTIYITQYTSSMSLSSSSSTLQYTNILTY